MSQMIPNWLYKLAEETGTTAVEIQPPGGDTPLIAIGDALLVGNLQQATTVEEQFLYYRVITLGEAYANTVFYEDPYLDN